LIPSRCQHDGSEKRHRQNKPAGHTQSLSQDSAPRKIPDFFLSSGGRPLYKRAPGEFICPVNRQILFGIVVLALIVPSASATARF
jgi:hypothetical protein